MPWVPKDQWLPWWWSTILRCPRVPAWKRVSQRRKAVIIKYYSSLVGLGMGVSVVCGRSTSRAEEQQCHQRLVRVADKKGKKRKTREANSWVSFAGLGNLVAGRFGDNMPVLPPSFSLATNLFLFFISFFYGADGSHSADFPIALQWLHARSLAVRQQSQAHPTWVKRKRKKKERRFTVCAVMPWSQEGAKRKKKRKKKKKQD